MVQTAQVPENNPMLTAEQEINNLKVVIDMLNSLVDTRGVERAELFVKTTQAVVAVANSLYAKSKATDLRKSFMASGKVEEVPVKNGNEGSVN